MRIIGKTTAVTLGVISGAVALSLAFSSGANALVSARDEYFAASTSSNAQLVHSAELSATLAEELKTSKDAATGAAGLTEASSALSRTSASETVAKKALRALNEAIASRNASDNRAMTDVSLLPWDYTSATERLRSVDAHPSKASAAAQTALTELVSIHKSVTSIVTQHAFAVTRAAAEAKYAAAAAAVAAESAQKRAVAQKSTVAPKTFQKSIQAAAPPKSNAEAARAVAAIPSFTSPPVSVSARDRALAIAAKQSSPYSVIVRSTFTPGYGANGVWDNGQSVIDAGGQNALQYSNGWTDVAAHNSNDSIALQLKVGDIVNFSGAISGSYRVNGSIDIPKGGSASVMGALGTKMMMQTCYWDNELMRAVGLAPV